MSDEQLSDCNAIKNEKAIEVGILLSPLASISRIYVSNTPINSMKKISTAAISFAN
jgi:hypothetical protein